MKININKEITDRLKDIKKYYESSRASETDVFRIVAEPFKVLKLNNVINDLVYIKSLKEAAVSVELNEKNNDLYSLKQSDSLLSCDSEPVKDFIRFLKRNVQPCLEEIVGYKFNQTISLTTSLYQQGDVLLCHDDKCEDRCVAFVYYLTSVNHADGGSFDMFQHSQESGQPTEVVVSIPPEVDSLVLFEVGNYTYHQVSEVTGVGSERLSINGWFHCDRALSIVPLKYKDPLPSLQHQVSLEGLVMLDEFINTTHCTPSYIDQVRETFSNESHILLPDFFTKSFYSLCESSFKSPTIKWLTLGPANRRKYESADLKSVKGPVNTLVNFVKSSLFVSYLKSISGLSLEPLAANEACTKSIVEVQRWTPGCYTMATDNDCFFDHDGLDIYLFFDSNEIEESEQYNGGSITYLDSADDPSDPDDDDDKELLTINPSRNSLCAVYRTSDTVRFTKYLNHRFKGTYYCLSATYYEADHRF